MKRKIVSRGTAMFGLAAAILVVSAGSAAATNGRKPHHDPGDRMDQRLYGAGGSALV